MSDCTHPIKAWKKIDTLESYRFDLPPPKQLHLYEPVNTRCRKCDKCLKVLSNEWAVRCAMEIATHEQSTFLTLTYDDEHNAASLNPEHMTQFLKDLRQHLTRKGITQKIRFYQCGEYGTKHGRRHHHALIFGYEFPDMLYSGRNEQDHKYYTSEILEKIWGRGSCTIGEANLATAIYTAGYIGKKIYGTKDTDQNYISGGSKNTHYSKLDKETGELIEIHKEFATMSRMPGLGYSYFQKFKSDMFPKGYMHFPSPTGELKRYPVPKYFYKKLAEEDPELYLKAQAAREKYAIQHEEQNLKEQTPERRKAKAKYARLIRKSTERPLDQYEPPQPVVLTDIEENIEKELQYTTQLAEQTAFERKFRHKLQSKS